MNRHAVRIGTTISAASTSTAECQHEAHLPLGGGKMTREDTHFSDSVQTGNSKIYKIYHYVKTMKFVWNDPHDAYLATQTPPKMADSEGITKFDNKCWTRLRR